MSADSHNTACMPEFYLRFLLVTAQRDDLGSWPFFVVLCSAGIWFVVISLDAFGGPFLNTLTAFWQDIFYAVTRTFFKTYPQLNKKTLPQADRQFLFDQLFFYKKLSITQRKAFDHRVVQFKASRTFVAKEDVQLTEDMKLLISATAVQLTFGLRSYLVKGFETILVYPRAYFNRQNQHYHKGEVNPKGLVVLSWEDFYEGVNIPDDNLNLGIHEFAHALALQRLQNRAYRDKIFVELFDKLMRSISNPMFRKQIQQRAGLRKYAIANAMEFFAVTSESFFENPGLLYHNHRTIYQLFAKMYNQDLIALYERKITPLTNSSLHATN